MKGITPVIAIILLLLITISLVGFAFIYFTRVTEIASTKTQEQLENVINTQQMNVAIDNVAGTSLALRNVGTSSIPVNKITQYIDNAIVNCNWGTLAQIAPGGVGQCTLASSCNAGSTIKVTSPGGQDSQDC